jgi:hypothetical protein
VDVVNSVSSELVVAGLTYAVTKMRGRKKRDAPWSPSIEDLESGGVDATQAVAAVFRDEDDLVVEGATHVGDAVLVRIQAREASIADVQLARRQYRSARFQERPGG